MKKIISFIISAALLSSTAVYAADFIDTKGHWAEAVISRLADRGVVSGVSQNAFVPDAEVTRAQYLKMIMNAVSLQAEECEKDMCLDASRYDWYSGYLNSALKKGLIPEEMITGYDVEIISDAEGTSAQAVYSGAFEGNKSITREEMAFLTISMYQYILNAKTMQSLDTSKKFSFTDSTDISIWAQAGVNLAAANGLVTGMDDGSFAPQQTATRAQAATIISRVLDKQGI